MELEDLGVFWDLSGGFRRWSTLRKILEFNENLDWLKIDFNAVEVITVQDYNNNKKN